MGVAATASGARESRRGVGSARTAAPLPLGRFFRAAMAGWTLMPRSPRPERPSAPARCSQQLFAVSVKTLSAVHCALWRARVEAW